MRPTRASDMMVRPDAPATHKTPARTATPRYSLTETLLRDISTAALWTRTRPSVPRCPAWCAIMKIRLRSRSTSADVDRDRSRIFMIAHHAGHLGTDGRVRVQRAAVEMSLKS